MCIRNTTKKRNTLPSLEYKINYHINNFNCKSEIK